MDNDKSLKDELKTDTDLLAQEIENARREARLGSEMIKQRMTGAMIYGGPMSRKWRKCLEWVKQDIKVNQKAEVKLEVFEGTAPFGWVFFLHPERGWLKYDMKDMLSSITRDTEIKHEAATDSSDT